MSGTNFIQWKSLKLNDGKFTFYLNYQQVGHRGAARSFRSGSAEGPDRTEPKCGSLFKRWRQAV